MFLFWNNIFVFFSIILWHWHKKWVKIYPQQWQDKLNLCSKIGQNHACSWPGSLHHQNIIKHHTDPASDFAGPTQEVFRLHYFLKYWKLSRYQRFLIAPWGIWMKYFQTNVIDWWLLWNCNQVNVAGTCWWYVNIRLDNGLVLSGNKPLLEPVLIQI